MVQSYNYCIQTHQKEIRSRLCVPYTMSLSYFAHCHYYHQERSITEKDKNDILNHLNQRRNAMNEKQRYHIMLKMVNILTV